MINIEEYEKLTDEILKEKFAAHHKPILEVVKEYNEKGTPIILAEISKKLNISAPLLSYYMNGNLKSKGLVAYEFVERVHGKYGLIIDFKITELGKKVLDKLQN